MPQIELQNNGQPVSIAYLDEGDGHPVILVHGFASTKEVNWVNTGWVRLLVAAGFRVVALDNRGHGASTKFHDVADYSLSKLVTDAWLLSQALELGQPHLVGYSMGARICATLAANHGDAFEKVVLSGNGWGMVEGSGNWDTVRTALLAPSITDVTDARAIAFRKFADQTGSDRVALAACVAGVRELIAEADLASIRNDVLVAVGSKDDVAGSGEKLAAFLQRGRFLPIPGRDHMRAVGDKVHMNGVLDFLTGA